MHLMGFTLNTMSLLALGLVAGVLVDDAIVEIENIVRHIRMGKTPTRPPSTRPTRSAWRWWPPPSRSSRCSCRWA
jgi:Cu/Ag efflux pump CusA